MGLAAYERFWSAPPTREAHVAGLLDIYDKVLVDAATAPARPLIRRPKRSQT